VVTQPPTYPSTQAAGVAYRTSTESGSPIHEFAVGKFRTVGPSLSLDLNRPLGEIADWQTPAGQSRQHRRCSDLVNRQDRNGSRTAADLAIITAW